MRQSLESLITQYQKHLFIAAYSICKNAEDAEDVVQDTFIQYYRITKEFKDEGHIRAWLLRVTINKARNTVSSFWNRNRNALEDESVEREIVFDDPKEHDLYEEVMKLPEKYRIVIHLFYYEELSVKEISDVLKISEGNVKMRLSRGRNLLRQVLKEDWFDD